MTDVKINDWQVTLLYVEDLERSMRFYGELLGLRMVYKWYGHVAYEVGNSRIMLSPRHPGHEEFDDQNPGEQSGWGVAIYFGVENVDQSVEYLRAQGVPVTEEPMNQPWGERDACLLDPDGYHIHLSQSTAKSWLKHLPFIE